MEDGFNNSHKSKEEQRSSVIKLDNDQQKILVGLLKEQLPETLVVYGMLKSIANQKWPYQEVFVDQWPDYHAVLFRATPDADGFNGKFVTVRSDDRDAIIKVLRHPGLIDWTKELYFDIPPFFHEDMTTIVPDGSHLRKLYVGQMFVVNPNTMKFSFSIDTPGISVSEIRQDDVPVIKKDWIQDPDMERFLTRLISLNLPTVCFRSETGEPVAYALTYIYDVITMLNVIPTYRRQGLAKVVISHMVQKRFKEEKFMGAQIRFDNEASRKLFYSCGFECLPEVNDFLVLRYLPTK